MKITTEMTQAAYSSAKDVYHKKVSKNDAVNRLKKNYNMNKASASNYIENFKRLMNGNRYARTHSIDATDYILTHILSDYGVDGLRNAIRAVKEHVDYYEELVKGNCNGIRYILERHEKILHSNIEFECTE